MRGARAARLAPLATRVAAGALALLAACARSGGELSPWVRLAQGFRPGAAAAVGAERDGVWRVELGAVAGDAISLAPLAREELALDVPPRSVLRFALAGDPKLEGAPGRVRVELDGRELFAREVPSGKASVWCEIELPASGAPAATLAFACEGAGAAVLFHPTIGPALESGARERGRRRDIVLFLADTFRADNLALYGGPEDLAPHLNRIAARAVRFRESRSCSTWTLPSIASLFTASHPPEHGAVGIDLSLAGELTTLAEHLRAHGYRTAAITDSFFVSRRHGIDHGFEWFEEVGEDEWDLGHTLAAADQLLRRDDGRPLFLFVHTYRAHKPYRLGAEEDGARFDAAWAGTKARARDDSRTAQADQALAEAATYRELYRQGVQALDAVVGPWIEGLESRGLLEHGLLVFTSDHGEAFGEHGEIFHRGRPYDVQVRVPLFLLGGGLAPREERALASLIDLPTTLARWAGIAPASGWHGRDLLGDAAGTRAFAFRIHPHQPRTPAEVALCTGSKKAYAALLLGPPPSAKLRGAFDLAQDPGEDHDLIDEGLAWPPEVFAALEQELLEISVSRVEAPEVELDAELRGQLEDLGYVEEEH